MGDPDLSVAISAIVSTVLGVDLSIARVARRGELEEWDSLRHIEIVFQVEELFGLQFSEDDLADFSDVDSISAAVGRIRGS